MSGFSRVFISRSLTYVALRISGALLAFLALGHFFVTHISTDVADTGSSFVTKRWSSSLWVTWDTVLLASALVHAFAGLVVIVYDYITRETTKHRVLILLASLIFILFVIGLLTIIISVFKIYST